MGGLKKALFGGGGKKTEGEQTLEIILDEATQNELFGLSTQSGALRGLEAFFGAGPGAGDISNATGAQRGFADMLKAFSESGGLPGAGDIRAAQGFAEDIFAPENVAFQQQLQDARIATGRHSVLLGRSPDDPILQAKLAIESARGRERISSRQTAFAANFAQALPERRLGFAERRVGVLQGLADRASQNKLTLFGLGERLAGQERQFRLNTATKRGFNRSSEQGPATGLIPGALGLAGSAADVAGKFTGLFSGGSSLGFSGGSSGGSSGGGAGTSLSLGAGSGGFASRFAPVAPLALPGGGGGGFGGSSFSFSPQSSPGFGFG